MNSRAWAFAAMICALLLGTPTTLADDADEGDDGQGDGLVPLSPGYLFDPEDLEDDCTSMLRATFVSFGGNVYETDIGEERSIAYVEGEHHLTIHKVTEFLRLVLDPLGEEVAQVVDTVESSETIVESTTIEGVLDVSWERDLLVWERIERTVAVPLPAEGSVSYAESDVVSSCDADDDLSIEFPVYGNDYDVVWGYWYYEPYAPDTPEPEWMYAYIDHTFTPGVPEGTEYDDYRHGHCACPAEVAQATADYVEGLHPVVEETIEEFESIFVEEEADEAEDEAPVFPSDEETDSAEALSEFLQGLPILSKASVGGGVGVAGLLGSILALRRR